MATNPNPKPKLVSKDLLHVANVNWENRTLCNFHPDDSLTIFGQSAILSSTVHLENGTGPAQCTVSVVSRHLQAETSYLILSYFISQSSLFFMVCLRDKSPNPRSSEKENL